MQSQVGSSMNSIDKAVTDADDALAVVEGVGQGSTPGAQGQKNGGEGAEAQITGEPEITEADAREISEALVMGTFGLVEDIWASVEYPKDVTEKGVARMTPIIRKHAAKMFPLAGRSVSVLSIYRAYGDELKAAWFFGNVIANTVRAIRAGKAKEGAEDDTIEQTPG